MSAGELVLRFVIGGAVVSTFALLGEVLRPKSFAGLFAAAPSVALASLGLTAAHHGGAYAAIEARSMVLGAFAFLVYAAIARWLLAKFDRSSLFSTLTALPAWFLVAFLLLLAVHGRPA